jgi:glycosyltransferase involved in cell wall biosynthesis
MNCLLSVLIPVYNAARFLPACLDSILAQDFTEYEVIVVNDGSTDDSAIVLQAYSTKFPRYLVVNQPNAGFGAARNTGMLHAKGEYLYFMDADDYLYPGLFKALASKIHSFPYDTIFFGFRKQYIGHKKDMHFDMIPPLVDCNSPTQIPQVLAILMTKGLGFGVWQQCIRRAAIQESGIRFTHLKREADIAFLLDFYPFLKNLTSIPKVYYQYQAYYVTQKNNPDILTNHIVLYNKLYALFRSYLEATTNTLLRRYFVLWFCHVVPLHLYKNTTLSKSEKWILWHTLLHHPEVNAWFNYVKSIPGGGLIQRLALVVYGCKQVWMLYLFTALNHFLKFELKLNYKRLFYRKTT